MEQIANLFEGCSIGRFKIDLLFKYDSTCTIHSSILTVSNLASFISNIIQ